MVQIASEAHFWRAVRDRLDLFMVHGFHFFYVERTTKIYDFHQKIVGGPRAKHDIVGLEISVHDPQTLQTRQALLHAIKKEKTIQNLIEAL